MRFESCDDFNPGRHPRLTTSTNIGWQWMNELGGLRDTYARRRGNPRRPAAAHLRTVGSHEEPVPQGPRSRSELSVGLGRLRHLQTREPPLDRRPHPHAKRHRQPDALPRRRRLRRLDLRRPLFRRVLPRRLLRATLRRPGQRPQGSSLLHPLAVALLSERRQPLDGRTEYLRHPSGDVEHPRYAYLRAHGARDRNRFGPLHPPRYDPARALPGSYQRTTATVAETGGSDNRPEGERSARRRAASNHNRVELRRG